MSKTFFAKPDQTYSEHIEAAYVSWKETVTAKGALIKRIAGKYGFSEEQFLKSSLLSVIFHDIGKMTRPFQDMVTAVRTGDKFDKRKNYRHELASFPFAVNVWHKMTDSLLPLRVPLEALAVVGHHKMLNTDISSFEREKHFPNPEFIEEGIAKAISLAKDIYSREGWDVLVHREMEFSGSRISYCSSGSNASNRRYRRPQLLPTALRSARLVSCVEPHSRFLVARNLLLLSPQGKTVLPFYT